MSKENFNFAPCEGCDCGVNIITVKRDSDGDGHNLFPSPINPEFCQNHKGRELKHLGFTSVGSFNKTSLMSVEERNKMKKKRSSDHFKKSGGAERREETRKTHEVQAKKVIKDAN